MSIQVVKYYRYIVRRLLRTYIIHGISDSNVLVSVVLVGITYIPVSCITLVMISDIRILISIGINIRLDICTHVLS